MIGFSNVTKRFSDKTVLDSFSHDFSDGSRICIMGASGRGKTTLLNLLLGLLTPDSGEISNLPVASAVFQEDRLCEGFSAFANVKSVLDKNVPDAHVYSILSELGLEGNEQKSVSELSGGMKRRVAIARALLADGELLVLDEPFKGLDEELHRQTAEVILSHLNGRTLVVATHDENDAILLGADILKL